jgi:hypothetical protein
MDVFMSDDPEVLVFHNPIFREHDLNTTVRPGTELAAKLELGMALRVEDGTGELVGTANVEGILITHVETVPSSWLLCDHDPLCRDLSGLIREMRRCYGNRSVIDPVTVILFTYTPEGE